VGQLCHDLKVKLYSSSFNVLDVSYHTEFWSRKQENKYSWPIPVRLHIAT